MLKILAGPFRLAGWLRICSARNRLQRWKPPNEQSISHRSRNPVTDRLPCNESQPGPTYRRRTRRIRESRPCGGFDRGCSGPRTIDSGPRLVAHQPRFRQKNEGQSVMPLRGTWNDENSVEYNNAVSLPTAWSKADFLWSLEPAGQSGLGIAANLQLSPPSFGEHARQNVASFDTPKSRDNRSEVCCGHNLPVCGRTGPA